MSSQHEITTRGGRAASNGHSRMNDRVVSGGDASTWRHGFHVDGESICFRERYDVVDRDKRDARAS